MFLIPLIFYSFAISCIAAAVMVIAVRNPVHSVLFLILTFFMVAGLFVLIGAEFLAFILLIVYVGAVAVLFLFVVMMLDIDFVRLREGMQQYMPIGATIGIILLLELILIFVAQGVGDIDIIERGQKDVVAANNTEALGQILYTDYILFFQLAGVILLVAMVGAIVLTLRHNETSKRQDIALQNARHPRDTIRLVDVKSGEGLK